MSSSDNYIVITESHDLNEEPTDSDQKNQVEGEEASRRTLEGQGISIIRDNDVSVRTESLDQFSRELMDEGGIEIVTGENED